MFIANLFEATTRQFVVTYPGRFQPFHLGHREVFAKLQAKFGADSVFIVTSNKTDAAKSPFNFADKVAFMNAAGVTSNHIIEAASPYKLPDAFASQESNVVFITAVGAPDAKRLAPGSTKKDGNPSYFQYLPTDLNDCVTADKHGYVIIADEIAKSVTLNGQKYDVSHGTPTRALWNQIRGDESLRKQFLVQMYGRDDVELGRILDKIPMTESVTEDAAGVGLVRNSKDPRYVMATTVDVNSKTLGKMMRAYNLVGKNPANTKQTPVKSNVAEARANTAGARAGLARRANAKPLSPEEQAAKDKAKSDKWLEKERAKMAAKKVAEDGEYRWQKGFGSYEEANAYWRDKAHETGESAVDKYGKGDAERYRRFVMQFVNKGVTESDDAVTEFYVYIGSESEGGWIGGVVKDGGKWREVGGEGNKPHNWGGTYMSYLTPDDIMQWMRQDYGRHYEVSGPFMDDTEAFDYAERMGGLNPYNEGVAEAQLGEVNPHNYDSDVDYYAALKAPARQRSSTPPTRGVDPDDEAYFREIFRKNKLAKQQQELAANNGVVENAEELNIGDDVIITGNVQFKGKTGIIDSFGRNKAFVIVNLYNHGKHSFHSSDVSYNDYADSNEEEADMYDRDEDFRNQVHNEATEPSTTNWDVYFWGNWYNGKYFDYGIRKATVPGTTESEAMEWIQNHSQEIYNYYRNLKGQNGRRLLPLPVEKNLFLDKTKLIGPSTAYKDKVTPPLAKSTQPAPVEEDLYQFDKEDPYNSEFAPRAGMGRMTLRGWKQSLIRRAKQLASELEAAGQEIDNAALWDRVYSKMKSLNMDPVAQEIELAHQELERLRRQGGVRARAFGKK